MSGPEDQHPWNREDEEIRQAFAEKDAEITRLKQLNLMTDEQVVMDLKAEVEQLKQKIKEQEEYIAKLKRNAKGITGQ
jgi:rubrerythrin